MATQDEALQERIRLSDGLFLAARIREARETADNGAPLSHDRLGERLGGVTRQHLIKLEQAKHRPRAETLRRYAEATGRSVDWFLGAPPRPFVEAGERPKPR